MPRNFPRPARQSRRLRSAPALLKHGALSQWQIKLLKPFPLSSLPWFCCCFPGRIPPWRLQVPADFPSIPFQRRRLCPAFSRCQLGAGSASAAQPSRAPASSQPASMERGGCIPNLPGPAARTRDGGQGASPGLPSCHTVPRWCPHCQDMTGSSWAGLSLERDG